VFGWGGGGGVVISSESRNENFGLIFTESARARSAVGWGSRKKAETTPSTQNVVLLNMDSGDVMVR